MAAANFPVRDDKLLGTEGDGEGGIECVVRRMIERECDFQGDIVQPQAGGRRRFHLGPQQPQPLLRFTRGEYISPNL